MEEAIEAFDSKAYEVGWRTTGHAYIGKVILRKFGSRLVVGQITKYLPAGGEYEPMLFKATHEDGDEEDLEEAEAEAAIRAAGGLGGEPQEEEAMEEEGEAMEEEEGPQEEEAMTSPTSKDG